MPSLLSGLLALAVVTIIGAVAVREHRKQLASRRRLLDACPSLLADGAIAHGRDGFPSLTGSYRGVPVRVELIPDTMTIRRLPQLWLSVTLLAESDHVQSFAALVRPNGAEFYSLTNHFRHRLECPEGLPREILIRGEHFHCDVSLTQLAPTLARLFTDPRLKEVAVTQRGLRLIRQACEGERGDHLILRQTTFAHADVAPEDLASSLNELIQMAGALAAQRTVAA